MSNMHRTGAVFAPISTSMWPHMFDLILLVGRPKCPAGQVIIFIMLLCIADPVNSPHAAKAGPTVGD